jgi:hypothetical protein
VAKAGAVMNADEQLQGWLRGEPKCPNDRGECCPDFSCCVPELLAPEIERRAFVDADQETREEMLMGFLCGAVPALAGDTKVHIAGTTPDREDA